MPYARFLSPPHKGIFGSYPIQAEVDTITDVDFLVDLTEPHEKKRSPYAHTDLEILTFPIKDYGTPSNWYSYTVFIMQLCAYIRAGRGLYIHCRAGHGRSSMVCASILCYLYDLHPEESIQRITRMHASRDGLSAKWQPNSIPLSSSQQLFLYKIYAPIYFSRNYISGTQSGFNTLSNHAVELDGHVFANTETAFQYLKAPDDEKYLQKLLGAPHKNLIKFIGDERALYDADDELTFSRMYRVYKLKYEQHPDLKEALRMTKLRRLCDAGKYSHSRNLVGRVLMALREEYVLSIK